MAAWRLTSGLAVGLDWRQCGGRLHSEHEQQAAVPHSSTLASRDSQTHNNRSVCNDGNPSPKTAANPALESTLVELTTRWLRAAPTRRVHAAWSKTSHRVLRGPGPPPKETTHPQAVTSFTFAARSLIFPRLSTPSARPPRAFLVSMASKSNSPANGGSGGPAAPVLASVRWWREQGWLVCGVCAVFSHLRRPCAPALAGPPCISCIACVAVAVACEAAMHVLRRRLFARVRH